MKKILQSYRIQELNVTSYQQLYLRARCQLRDALSRGLRVVFVDECIFTTKTIDEKSYSKSKKNIRFPLVPKLTKTIHLAAGVSLENGLEGFELYEGSVNSERFLDSITNYTRNGRSLVLLGDNASWHTSATTFAGLSAKGLFFIKNVPYSPQLNPIESESSPL